MRSVTRIIILMVSILMMMKVNAQTKCDKLPIAEEGIIRYSVIDVVPEYLDEYFPFALDVGEISMRTEPGVLALYPTVSREDSCRVTILYIYASQDDYKRHIASPHFQKYKQGTLHMVKSLQLLDQKPLNPAMSIKSEIR